MEAEWTEILQKGEKLLWEGKAAPFETLDPVYKPVFIRKTIASAVIVLAIVIAYVIAAGENIKPLMIFIIAALGSIGPINTLRDAKALRKITYAATDLRLISVTDAVRSVEYGQIREASWKKDIQGHPCLLCGKDAVRTKETRWREFSVAGAMFTGEDSNECERFAMLGMTDADKLHAVLREKLPCLKD